MVLDELLAIEHEGWHALCERRGAAFYGEIMTEDAVMILAHGMVLDRDAVIASLNDAPPWETYEISEARTVGLSTDATALVYRGAATRHDADSVFRALMASSYVRRDGRWRLACYQQTPVPEGP